jgi:hypothetical protein
MDLTVCPHCKTRVFAPSHGECPSCRKPLDAAADPTDQAEAPWATELPEPVPGLVTVARFTDPVEASLAKNFLEGAGLPAVLTDAETVAVAWPLSNALGGIKLQVAEPDAPIARTVLRERLYGSADDRTETVREAAEAASRPGEGGEELPPDDESWEEPGRELTGREGGAERAFRAAVFGLLFFPLQFYATYLLLVVLFSPEALDGRARGRAWIAAGINVTFLLALIGFGSLALRVL